METIEREKCFWCSEDFLYDNRTTLDSEGNVWCEKCSSNFCEVQNTLIGILRVGDYLINCKSSAKRFSEKSKKLFLIDVEIKAFWSAEEFGSKKVFEMQDFFVPKLGEIALFREDKNGWLVVVKNQRVWRLYRGSGGAKNFLFPGEDIIGEVLFEVIS